MKVRVTVMPKTGVLDPQGKAVSGSMQNLGLPEITGVRIGKHITLHVEAADKKAAELKKLGLEAFLVVQESGPNQFAVSLGLYKSEQGARERLAAVQGKGARSARIQVRESPTDKMLVEVRGPLERFARALADLPADLDAPTPADCGTARQTR